MKYSMTWTAHDDWHSVFVTEHVSPSDFIAGLQETEGVTTYDDSFDEELDSYADYIREDDVRQEWWIKRPPGDADDPTELEYLMESVAMTHPGAFVVTVLYLP